MSDFVSDFTLSIVVPCFNESSTLDSFFRRTIPIVEGITNNYEIICVNDGSTDDTLSIIIEHGKTNRRIKYVDLSRNFGKEAALTAGIDHSTGDAVIPIDADLQDPPEVIPAMVTAWQKGADVVYGQRRTRSGESWLKKATAYAFYRLFSKIGKHPIPQDTGDFRLIDRGVVNELMRLRERNRFMKGLFAWVGFNQVPVLYDREPRSAGTTAWSYWKLWNFAIDGITSFSGLPLKIWSYIGICISCVSMAYASLLTIRTIIFGIDVPGYASLIVSVLFLGGIQLVSLGVLGEYISRIYEEVKMRPVYLERSSNTDISAKLSTEESEHLSL